MRIGDATPVNVCFVAASADHDPKPIDGGGVKFDYEILRLIKKQVTQKLNTDTTLAKPKTISDDNGLGVEGLGMTQNQIIASVVEKADFVVFIVSPDLSFDDSFSLLLANIFEVNSGEMKKIQCVYVLSRAVVRSLLPQPKNECEHIPILPIDEQPIHSIRQEERMSATIEVSMFIATLIANCRLQKKLEAANLDRERMRKELDFYRDAAALKGDKGNDMP